jgi:hypothetical protein
VAHIVVKKKTMTEIACLHHSYTFHSNATSMFDVMMDLLLKYPSETNDDNSLEIAASIQKKHQEFVTRHGASKAVAAYYVQAAHHFCYRMIGNKHVKRCNELSIWSLLSPIKLRTATETTLHPF